MIRSTSQLHLMAQSSGIICMVTINICSCITSGSSMHMLGISQVHRRKHDCGVGHIKWGVVRVVVFVVGVRADAAFKFHTAASNR